MPPDRYRVGFDIGGTFTDFVLHDAEREQITLHKCLTTPRDPSVGALEGLDELLRRAGIGFSDVAGIVHGTTLVTNSIIEQAGAKLGLITTRGFRDILEMGTEQRYDIYDLFLRFPPPLVRRRHRLEATERIDRDGRVVVPLDLDSVRAAARQLVADGVEAVAVCFLHAYQNPAHERAVAALLAREFPSLYTSLSSDVVAELREYQRTVTTCANAYVQPLMSRYLARIERELAARGFRGALRLMHSAGGLLTPEAARAFPIRLLESGPAGGGLATALFGKLAGKSDVISFDMGGTTAKACLVEDGRTEIELMMEAARVHRFKRGSGLPVKIPTIDMIEIGAGGGSIAAIDEVGLLRVGPRSAGADPGPACYGRGGTQATVTDANVYLGRLAADFLLAGDLALDAEAAGRALDPLAGALGLSRERVAQGIVDVATGNMAQALRLVSTDRGHDPRGSTLVAYGGAGPLYACELARSLQIHRVLIPRYPGAFSALGALLADTRFDYTRTAWMRLRFLDLERANALFAELERQALEDFRREGFDEVPSLQRSVDLRYVGQNWELTVSVPGGTLAREDFERAAALFEAEHERFYGYSIPGEELELLTFNVAAVGARHAVDFPRIEPGAVPAPLARRPVVFSAGEGPVETAVHRREALPAGAELTGPAIVGQLDATTLLPPGSVARVDEYGNLLIEV